MRTERIGDAVLYLGNVLDLLPALSADIVIADPPYGVGESSRKNATRGKPYGGKPQGRNTRGTAIPPLDYGQFNWDEEPATEAEIAAALHAGKNAIVWGANHFGMPASAKWLVWDKQNSGDFADCELAWTNLPGAVRIFRHMWNGMLRASERETPRVHPTQKPIALMDWCVDQSPGVKIVGEPWMGSAPGGCAAVARGLAWWGIDNDPRSFEIACERIENAYRQKPLFEPARDVYSQTALDYDRG